jgi:hypothetical protein
VSEAADGSWMDTLNRAIVLLVNVAIALVLSAVFSLMIQRGVYEPITGHEKWRLFGDGVLGEIAGPAKQEEDIRACDLARFIQQAETVGIWKRYHWQDFVLLAAIAMTLQRLLHSFFKLYADGNYRRLTQAVSPGRRRTLCVLQLFAQCAVLLCSLAMVLYYSGDTKMLCFLSVGLIFVLVFWDVPAWWIIKEVETDQSAINELQSAFHKWAKIEKWAFFALCVVAFLYWLDSVRRGVGLNGEDSFRALELAVSGFLLGVWLADYLWNQSFYTHYKGAPL